MMKPGTTHKNEHYRPVRSKERFLVFGSPLIQDEEIDEVVSTMRGGWLGTGPKVHAFERKFAGYKSVQYTAAVNSCTAALHLSLLAAGIKNGDEVITTSLTFCATVNAIIHAGGTPVLADVDPITMNINPNIVEALITPRTKALLPVHFAGRPCDMDSLKQIAIRHNLKIIEDCAHAIETEYHGNPAGTIGDYGCFSFYVTKNIVTGEGGMVVTKNEVDLTKIKILGLHGMSKDAWKRFGDDGYRHYQVVECGYKYNMMDLQAAIGIHQLDHIDDYWKRRSAIWDRYNRELADLPITLPAAPEPDTLHAYHLYTILVDENRTGITRDEFLNSMTMNNIGVGVHYMSIPEHPFYKRTFGWVPENYPHAKLIGRQTVSIPISPKLTDEDVDDVIRAVKVVLQRK